MESNYKLVYQSATYKDLKHSHNNLISDIEDLKYMLDDYAEYSEDYIDLKRDISELEHELKYVNDLIDLHNQTK